MRSNLLWKRITRRNFTINVKIVTFFCLAEQTSILQSRYGNPTTSKKLKLFKEKMEIYLLIKKTYFSKF